MQEEVIAYAEGQVGRIRLNRPKAIHALNIAMCEAITTAILNWEKDDSIALILIDHAEGRGFCAGGDIAMMARSAQQDCREAEVFFRAEYSLNHLLFTCAKPIMAFMDGITMGGGVGLSLPCRYRIATERTVFAMPEISIGLFPDVGASWYLPRLPGRSGVWLATTGARITGADCLALGLANHFIASDQLDHVKQELLTQPTQIDRILDAAGEDAPSSDLAQYRDAIDHHFASDEYACITASLKGDGGEWAQQQLTRLTAGSPQTVKVALREMALGAHHASFADAMRMEYRLACNIIRRPDFVEGVRALIFDKDNQPRWNPATAEEVDHTLVESLFAALPPEQEWHPLTGREQYIKEADNHGL